MQSDDITIPPDAVEAGMKAVMQIFGNDLHAAAADRVATAAIRAALAAWPGVKLENLCGWVMDGPDLPYVEETASIILPLTTENPDAKA